MRITHSRTRRLHTMPAFLTPCLIFHFLSLLVGILFTSSTHADHGNITPFDAHSRHIDNRHDYLTSFSVYYYGQSSFQLLTPLAYNSTREDARTANTLYRINSANHEHQVQVQTLVSWPNGTLSASEKHSLHTVASWVNNNPLLWNSFDEMRNDARVRDVQHKLIDAHLLHNKIHRVLVSIKVDGTHDKQSTLTLMSALVLNRIRDDNAVHILQEVDFREATMSYSRELRTLLLHAAKSTSTLKIQHFALEWFLNYLVQSQRCRTRAHCLWMPLRDMINLTIPSIDSDMANDVLLPVDVSPLLANLVWNTYPNLLPSPISTAFDPAAHDTFHKIPTLTPEPHVILTEYAGIELDVAIRRATGFVKASKLYKSFEADRLMAQLAQLELNVIDNIRTWYTTDEQLRSVFRYLIINPRTCPFRDDPHYAPAINQMLEDSTLMGRIPVGEHGTTPLILPGESIVLHQRSEHRFNILGAYNPSLINYEYSHVLENKWIEYKFWQHYVPGVMPRTELLSELIEREYGRRENFTCTPEEFLHVATKAFPQGWVLKGANDYASEFKILTDSVDVLKEHATYDKKRTKFDAFVAKQRSKVSGCEENEDLLDVLRTRSEYFGYKLDLFFKSTNEALLQHKLGIQREFRVEVVAGQVLEEAILDRFYFRDIETSSALAKRVAEFVRKEILGRLPDALRFLPMTMDVACLEGCGNVNETSGTYDGTQEFDNDSPMVLTLIEANPGAQSWFSHTVAHSVNVVDTFLWNLPSLYHRERYLRNPISPHEQIKAIQEMLNKFGMRRAEHYPLYDLHEDAIADRNVKIRRIEVDLSAIGGIVSGAEL